MSHKKCFCCKLMLNTTLLVIWSCGQWFVNKYNKYIVLITHVQQLKKLYVVWKKKTKITTINLKKGTEI